MSFENSDNALLLWLIINDFFPKYNRTGVFNQWEIGNGHAEVFKTKCILNFRKYRKVEKKFRFGWVKIGKIKSNKIEKTEELIAQYSIKVYE